jgi:hypothetical protein
MTITLTPHVAGGSTAIALPADLIWTDELTWSPVAQSTERTAFGHLVIDAMARSGGRPITLQGDGDSAWITRGTLRAIKALADVPGQRLTLDIRGESFTVVFDHGTDEPQGKAIAMQSVIEYSDKQDGDYYCSLTLRFIDAAEAD